MRIAFRSVLIGLACTFAASAAAPTIASVVNAGNFDSRIAVGGDVAIFGSGFDSTATVSIDGTAAYVISTAAGQINAQLPWSISTGTVNVTVTTTSGGASTPYSIAVSSLAPAISNILHAANFQPVTSSNKAVPGETLEVFMVGLGPTTPTAPFGLTPSSPVYATSSTPGTAVSINGGAPIVPMFSGLAPSLTGIYQVNFAVPLGTPSGDLPLVVSIGGATSNTGTLNMGTLPAMTFQTGPNYGTYALGRIEAPIQVSGGTGNYTISVSGSLPPGTQGMTEAHPPSWWQAGVTYGIVGVTATPGTYPFTITVNDGNSIVTQSATITVSSVLITDEYTLPLAAENTNYSRQLHYASALTGTPSFTLTAGSLPLGLTLSGSGLISGVLPNATAGTYTFTVQAALGTASVSKTFTVTVLPNVITNAQVQVFSSTSVSQQFTVTPSATVTWSLTGGSLPSGLTLSSGGLLSGTISSPPGNWFFQVSAYSGTTLKAQQNFTVQYRPGSTASGLIGMDGWNTLPSASVGTSYVQWFSAHNGVMTTSGYSWAITSGSLPDGMWLATGANQPGTCCWFPGGATIAGSPRVPGTYNFTLTATDSSTPPVSVSRNFTLDVVTLDTDVDYSPAATRGFAYSGYFKMLGGTPPYTVTMAGGSSALPSGLALNSDGTLGGTPREGGNFYPLYTIRDSSTPQLTIPIRQEHITVNSDIGGAFQITFDGSTPGPAVRNASFSFTVKAYGATGSYRWSVYSGSLPPGLSLSTFGPSATTNISGTATTAGTYTFAISATDNTTATYYAIRQYTIQVTNLSVAATALPWATSGVFYTTALTASGAVGTLTWTVTPGRVLPPGLSLTSAGVLSGTPSSAGNFTFSIDVVDSGVTGSKATYYYSLDIYPPGQTPPLAWTTGPTFGPVGIGQQKFGLNASGGRPPYTFSISSAGTLTNFRVQNGQPLPNNYAFPASLLGVALAPGTYNFTLRVTDADLKFTDQTATLTVHTLGQGMNPTLPYAVNGLAYWQQLTATGGTSPYTFTSNGTMPGGVSVTPAGVLTATAVTAAVGTPSVPIKVTDSAGNVWTSSYTLPVQKLNISWTDGVSGTTASSGASGGSGLPNATVGVFYTTTLAASNGTGSYSWSLNSGSLPNGLTLNGATGEISGTSTAYGNYQIQVRAADGSGNTGLQWLQLAVIPAGPVAPAITSASFNGFTVGQFNYFQISVAGGAAPYVVTADTALPPGIALAQSIPGRDMVQGVWYIYGRGMSAGTYPITLRVTDAYHNTSTATYNFVVSPLYLDTTSLPDRTTMTYGVPFATQSLLAMGGSGAYTFSAVQPLMAGMNLSGAGAVSGTPGATGTITSQISITDANDSSKSLIQNISLTAASGTPSTLTINTGPNLGPVSGGGYGQWSLTASGSPLGTPNYVYSVEAGSSLPAGLTILTGNQVSSGTNPLLAGWLYTPGLYTFTLRVTDASGNIGLKTFTLTVSPSYTYSQSTLPAATVNIPYSFQFYSNSSVGSPSYSIAAGSAPPPGLTLSASGLLSGMPSVTGLFPFTFIVSDGVTQFPLRYTANLRVTGMAITSGDILDYTNGVAKTFSFTQTGAAGPVTWGWNLSSSCGLTLNATTGAVTGTPGGCNGLYTVTVTASDGASTMTQQVAINIHNPYAPLSISTVVALDNSVGQVGTQQFGAAGGLEPYTWSVAPGSSLPAGMQFASGTAIGKSLGSSYTPSTGWYYGFPTAAGTYTFTLQVTDSSSPPMVARMTYTQNISPVSLESTLRNGVYGVPYTNALIANSPNGPVTCSLAYGFLPTGLSLNGCTISGTPLTTGAYLLGLRLADSTPYPLVVRTVLTINSTANATANPTVTMTAGYPIDNAVGGMGRTISAGVASPGTGPFTFSIVDLPGLSSRIPTGMTISQTATNVTLSGAPTTPGLYTYTVKATDSAPSQNFGQRTYVQNVSAMQYPLATFQVQQVARAGQTYNFTIPVAGGTPPYSYAVVTPGTLPNTSNGTPYANQTLPTGLTLNTSTGMVSGTPSGTGTFTPAIRITDSTGATYTILPTFYVYPAGGYVTLNGSSAISLPDWSVGVPVNVPIDGNVLPGGAMWYYYANPPVTVTLHAGSTLPPGVNLVPASGANPPSLAGTPTAAAQPATFVLDLTDASGQVLTKTVSAWIDGGNITPPNIPNGTVGVPYSVTLTGSGGAAPYTFTGVGLPPGLSITAAGTIYGTPTYAGRYPGHIEMVDATGVAGNGKWLYFTMVIGGTGTVPPQLSVSPLSLQVTWQKGTPLPTAIPLNVGSSGGAVGFTASTSMVNGSGWLSISASGGTAPAPMTLTISPSLLAVGTYTGAVTLTGALPDNGTVTVPVTLTVTAQADCTFSITPGSGSISASGGTTNVSVTASASNCSWSAAIPAADVWVTFNGGAGGSGNGAVVLSATANNVGSTVERSSTVTITGQKNATETVQLSYKLTQFGQTCSFTVSPTAASLPSLGGNVQVSLNASASTCPWTASVDASGALSIDAGQATSGTGSATFSLTVGTNASANGRTASFTASGGATPAIFTVTQGGVNCTTAVGLATSQLTYTGGNVSVPVTVPSGCGFNITPGPNWISITGTTAASVNLSVAPNSSTSPRTGTILIGGLPFLVSQDGVPCSFTLGNNKPLVGSGIDSGSITVTTNDTSCGWVAASNASFLTLNGATSGNGSGTVTFSVTPNSSQSPRSGTISIAGQNVTVQQGGLTCSYSLQSTNATVNGLGGTGTASVIAPPGCTFNAMTNTPVWLSVTSGASGTGSANVGFTAAANGSAAARSGTLTIAGITFTVNQTGKPCTYSLPVTSYGFPTNSGGANGFTFSTTTTDCSPNVQSYEGWLTATKTFDASTGLGSVSFTAQSNPTGTKRTGTISVEDQTFTVTVPAADCKYTLGASGAAFDRTGGSGFVQFTPVPGGCTPTVTAQPGVTLLGPPWTTDAVSGQDINFNVAPYQTYVNWVRIMQINISGNIFTVKQTSW